MSFKTSESLKQNGYRMIAEQLPDSAAFIWYVSVIRYETGFIKSRSLQRSANKRQT